MLENAPLIAASFTDGALLMHYARQRSRQEKYSLLARRWVKSFREAVFPGKGLILPHAGLRRSFFSGRIIIKMYGGISGLVAATGMDSADSRLVFAAGAMASGYMILGRQLFSGARAGDPALLRAFGLAGRFNGLPAGTHFSTRRLRSIYRSLVCLGRISRTVRNCQPYKNAHYILKKAMRVRKRNRGRYILRLAAVFNRLRRQTAGSVQEFALRLLAMDTAENLLRMTRGMLIDRYRLLPGFTPPGSYSFSAVPGVFWRRLRLVTKNSKYFRTDSHRSRGLFSVRLRFEGDFGREFFGGVRLDFRTRYRGVDFHIRDARVRHILREESQP